MYLTDLKSPNFKIYAEERKAAEKEGAESEYEVLVLRGGFTEFQTKFKASPSRHYMHTKCVRLSFFPGRRAPRGELWQRDMVKWVFLEADAD